MTTALLIRILTGAALFALLFAVGLRLTWSEVITAIRRCHFTAILAVNFLWIPIVTVAATTALNLPAPIAIGMILLASAPFAPMVPIFARLARADLALAAGLTALFPILSALFTPLVCLFCLHPASHAGELYFNFPAIVGLLMTTVTVPLGAGIALRRSNRALAERILRPTEVISQIVGAAALAFVVVSEFRTVLSLGWKPVLVMAALTEVSLWSGYAVGGVTVNARRAVALGTCCRNLALAVLIAASSFAGTPVVGAVVANGLLFILVGLVHVAWWRHLRNK